MTHMSLSLKEKMATKEKAGKRSFEELENSLRLSNRIWELRRKKLKDGKKLYDLLSRKEYYRLLERGNNPTYYTLCKVAKLLEMPLARLLTFDYSREIVHFEEYPYVKFRKRKYNEVFYINADGSNIEDEII